MAAVSKIAIVRVLQVSDRRLGKLRFQVDGTDAGCGAVKHDRCGARPERFSFTPPLNLAGRAARDETPENLLGLLPDLGSTKFGHVSPAQQADEREKRVRGKEAVLARWRWRDDQINVGMGRAQLGQRTIGAAANHAELAGFAPD